MTPTPLLDIVDLHRHFGGNRAVNGVDLQVHHGETVGLVGESGSGKTTIGQTIVGMGSPTSGEIRYDGHDITGLSRGRRRELATSIQYIFQDPYGSLNPRMSVGEAIAEPLIAHGLATRASASDRVRDILEICGMPADSAERYPHEFSGGQRQRIVIARAMALEPDLVVADEPVSALDVSVQAQIINLFSDLREQRGTAFLFISHDLGVVWHLCDRVVILDKGVVVESGTRAQIFEDARHPYTRALLAAVPVPDPRARTRHAVERLLAEDNQRVPGQQAPVLVDIGDGHLVGYGG